jgi:hypothetical protein
MARRFARAWPLQSMAFALFSDVEGAESTPNRVRGAPSKNALETGERR